MTAIVTEHNHPDDAAAAVAVLASKLARAEYSGWDPYDALTSPALRAVARTPMTRRLALQAGKRSPLNLRPLLGIRPLRHIKALALVVSALSRLAQMPNGDAHRQAALRLARDLVARAVESDGGIGWAYDFDVQTRWGYYAAGEPNAIATVFATGALLDVAALAGGEEFAEAAARVPAFARSLAVSENGEHFFGYYRGSRVPIHNANVLVAALLARLQSDLELASSSAAYTLARQRPDGSWPYGEARGLAWVDGFHTAYVLSALDDVVRRGVVDAGRALATGLSFYVERLIDPDGAARASVDSRYPVDCHAAATAIWMLSRFGHVDGRSPAIAGEVLSWTLEHLRRADGGFAFQQHRRHRNSVSYVRWSDAHMLLALATYLEECS